MRRTAARVSLKSFTLKKMRRTAARLFILKKMMEAGKFV
jgi:hypothetical protein